RAEGRVPGEVVFSTNVRNTYHVCRAAVEAGVRKIVFASSIQAYGTCLNGPSTPGFLSVPLYLPIDEAHPLLPRGAYSLSKAVGAQTVAMFARRYPRLQAW